MSRIEEAIWRTKGSAKPTPDSDREHTFMPAWPELESERPAHDEVLGSSVKVSSEWRERLATGPKGDPVLVEQFRRLAATLHRTQEVHGLRSVMVTSAGIGDGKTLTACNLAFVLAETYGHRVLLMDGDLRRPSISNMLDLSAGLGLVDALRSPNPQKLALAQLTPRLTLLPAGKPTSNSIEALVSPRMRTIVEEASAKFDWVVLDAPPVGPSSDARLLSHMVGGALFVIRAGKSQHADVQKGIDAIGRDRILGVVLNDAQHGASEAYYYSADEAVDKR